MGGNLCSRPSVRVFPLDVLITTTITSTTSTTTTTSISEGPGSTSAAFAILEEGLGRATQGEEILLLRCDHIVG